MVKFPSIMAKSLAVASTPPRSTGGQGRGMSYDEKVAFERFKYPLDINKEVQLQQIRANRAIGVAAVKAKQDAITAKKARSNRMAESYLKQRFDLVKQYTDKGIYTPPPVTMNYLMAAEQADDPVIRRQMYDAVPYIYDQRTKDPKANRGFVLLLYKNRPQVFDSHKGQIYQTALALMKGDQEVYNKTQTGLDKQIPDPAYGVVYDDTGSINITPSAEKQRLRWIAHASKPADELFNSYTEIAENLAKKNILGGNAAARTPIKESTLLKLKKNGFASPPQRKMTFTAKSKIKGVDLPKPSEQKRIQKLIFNHSQKIATEYFREDYEERQEAPKLEKQHLLALSITAYKESSYNPKAKGDGGASIGLFMINTSVHKYSDKDKKKLEDPKYNIEQILTEVKWFDKENNLAGKGMLSNEQFMNASTAEEAVDIMTRHMQKPKNTTAQSIERQTYVGDFKESIKIEDVEYYKSSTIPEKPTTPTIFDQRRKYAAQKKSRENLVNIVDGYKFLDENIYSAIDVYNYLKDTGKFKTSVYDNSKFSTPEDKGKEIIRLVNSLYIKHKNAGKANEAEKNRLESMKNGGFRPNNLGSNITINGEKKTIKPLVDMRSDRFNQSLSNSIERFSPGESGTVTSKPTDADIAISEVALFEKHLQNSVPDVRWINGEYVGNSTNETEKARQISWADEYSRQFIEKHSGDIINAIQQSSNVKARRAHMIINPGEKNFPALSKNPEILRQIREQYKRRELFIKGATEVSFMKKKVNVDGVSTDAYVPMPSTNANMTHLRGEHKDIIERKWKVAEIRIPDSLNNLKSFPIPVLDPHHEEAVASRILTDGNFLIGDPNIPIHEMEKVNKKITDIRAIAKRYLSSKDMSSSKELYTAIHDPVFQQFDGLKESMVAGIAWKAVQTALIKAQKDVPGGENIKGIPFPAMSHDEQFRFRTADELQKSRWQKEVIQVLRYAPNALELIDSIIFTFGQAAVIRMRLADPTIKDHGVPKEFVGVYETAVQNIKKSVSDYGPAAPSDSPSGLLFAEIQGIKNDVSLGKETRANAEAFHNYLLGKGGERLSDIPNFFDKFITKLKTLPAVAKDYVGSALGGFIQNAMSGKLDGLEESEFYYRKNNGKKHELYESEYHDFNEVKMNERGKFLQGVRERTNKKLAADLADAEKRMDPAARSLARTTALLNARRVFSAITLTYMFAGMVQGGSGGRAISNEDFEHLYNALWSGQGDIQPANIMAARSIVKAAMQRAIITSSSAHYGDDMGQIALNAVLPYQRYAMKMDLAKQADSYVSSGLIGESNTQTPSPKRSGIAFVQKWYAKVPEGDATKIHKYETVTQSNMTKIANNMLQLSESEEGTSWFDSIEDQIENGSITSLSGRQFARRLRADNTNFLPQFTVQLAMNLTEFGDKLIWKKPKDLRSVRLSPNQAESFDGMSLNKIAENFAQVYSKNKGKVSEFKNPALNILIDFTYDILPLLYMRHKDRKIRETLLLLP